MIKQIHFFNTTICLPTGVLSLEKKEPTMAERNYESRKLEKTKFQKEQGNAPKNLERTEFQNNLQW